MATTSETPKVPITVAHGDGIGPEIMKVTLAVLDAAGARLDIDTIDIGEKLFLSGHSSGIDPAAWDSLRRTKVFLKAPITTPMGGGYKSLNVTVRKSLGLFANVRPAVSYHPFVATKHPDMDMVIIRENEEDTYAGIEHRQTQEVTQCLKLITRPGSERISRFAFEYARANGRKKVTVLVKDNIMKITDGLFHAVFNEVATEYPDIVSNSLIIDIGTARIANRPLDFDVVVAPNLYGDVVSDVAAEVTGSVGLAPSANIGDEVSMFEAVHGSAPDIAGKGIANPSGLLLAAVMMLNHIDQRDVATLVHNAWLRTIEEGVHTGDIFTQGFSKERVGTEAFGEAVIARLGQRPQVLKAHDYEQATESQRHRREDSMKLKVRKEEKKELVGVDVFLDWKDDNRNANTLGARLEALVPPALKLKMITNRGVKVYPDGMPETFHTDHWRCRFMSATKGAAISHADVVALLQAHVDNGLDFIKTEHLYTFDGERGFSLGQGE